MPSGRTRPHAAPLYPGHCDISPVALGLELWDSFFFCLGGLAGKPGISLSRSIVVLLEHGQNKNVLNFNQIFFIAYHLQDLTG